jgi:hypothetical protein
MRQHDVQGYKLGQLPREIGQQTSAYWNVSFAGFCNLYGRLPRLLSLWLEPKMQE